MDWDGMTERRISMVETLAEMRQDIKTLVSNQKEIKEQVIKTNGRVTGLEKFEYMAKGVIAVIVLVGIPVVLHVIYQWISNNG